MKFAYFPLSSVAALALAGCIDASEPATSPQDLPRAEVSTRAQAVVDQGQPNWMIAGADGLLELVGGTDGEPDVLTGRFVLDGNAITAAAAGMDRWIVVGDGKLQAVDADALRLREVRDALEGEAIRTIVPAPVGWLIGGENGRIQLLDAEGEPTQTAAQPFPGATVTAASWNGNSWLFGSEGGQVIAANDTLNSGLDTPDTVLGGQPVVTIVTARSPVNGQSVEWYVFSKNAYEMVTGGGTPQGANTIDANLEITRGKFLLNQIVLGTADGRVGVFSTVTKTVAWTSVFSNEGVSALETDGTDILVLGAQGSARLLDAALQPKAAARSLATDRTPVAAWFVNGRWMTAIGEIAFVEFVAADLSPLRTLGSVMDGADILASDAADSGVLLVGQGGRVQLVDAKGVAKSSVATVAGANALRAVAWNGEVFLTVGDNGVGQLVAQDGSLMGSPLTLIADTDLRFAAWSGEYWLVGGEGGKYVRVRPDGTLAGEPGELASVTSLNAARFNGRAWMMGGTDGTNAIYTLIQRDGSVGPVRQIANFPGEVLAVEFNGLEWMLGGSAGLTQRLSSEGQVVGNPVDMLNGYDVRDIYFNGVNYFVSGQFGAIRRVSSEGAGVRAPIAVINQRDANTLVWTRARGFAGGICLSNDACYEGPCVGGLAEGACCASACDRPCESCFQRDTGEADGTCAPVVAGKQPPATGGCTRASEGTCGYTGLCDGAGECQFYGADITCGEAACASGKFTAIASCDGAGMCAIPAEQDCHPYAGCTPEGGCATGCGSNSDCVAGYECDDGACVQPEVVDPNEPKPGDEATDDGGCCTTVHHRSTTNPIWFIALASLLSTLFVRRGAK